MASDTETILVVDDEADDLAMMTVALQDQGFDVFKAGNYDEALRIFDWHRDEIALLLSDISLPGNNGCELARAILKLKPDLKVLFVSGHTGSEICRFYGFSISDLHFLRKPFDSAALIDRVRTVIASEKPFSVSEKASSASGEPC